MWIKKYSKIYKGIDKEIIWDLWTDVNNWPKWQQDLEYCKMEGPFEVGNHFILKPKGISPVRIEIIEIEKGYKFTDCTKFFGAKMYDMHEIKETKEGLLLTNTLSVTGFLKWVWIKLVAQNVAKTVPDEMQALVELARSESV